MRRVTIASLCAWFLLGSVGHATLVNVSGSWSATINGQGYTNQSFTGSATFSYDNASVPGAGFFPIDNIPLSSLTFSPNPVGLTTFDTSNSRALVQFMDGVVISTIVGGSDGGPGGMNLGTTDFWAIQAMSTEFRVQVFPPSDGDAFDSGASISFTHTAVPEASSFLCLGSLAVGVLGWKAKVLRRNR